MISRPAPEADEHVQAHRHEALGPVRHRRHLDAQQLLAERRGHLVGRLERRLDLAQEERAVDLEVVVVAAVERVEVERALALQVLAIGLDGPLVPRDDVAVAAAQHVDVRRHVLQVPGVGHEPAQLVGRRQRALRKRRHLHRVEVQVQQPGVRLRRARHAPLQHGERLERVGALGRLAGLQVPELPRSPADQRLGEQRGHVGIVAELAVGGPHRLGVGVAPERALLGRRRRREARCQRLDQRTLDRGRAVEQRVRPLDGRARERDHRRSARPARTRSSPCCSSGPSRRRCPSGPSRRPGSASTARWKQRTASSWLKPYDHARPRSNQACASGEEVETGRL